MSEARSSPAEDRWISLGRGLARIPERLLLAHSQGKVLFITGAGTSRSSGLPDFRGLVLDTYAILDPSVHGVLSALPPGRVAPLSPKSCSLNDKQCAEANRFVLGEYDVVLGMLERRVDGVGKAAGTVRRTICDLLRGTGTRAAPKSPLPSDIHRALMRLADRGQAVSIGTTNFDRLLESAAKGRSPKPVSWALGGIPRPGRGKDFSGVLHIHGALSATPKQPSEILVTDHDLGEFYLRRRIVPDFIYDAARLFHLVLVGYSANDAPMRYLLNAVAADGSRFDDLKERFTFVGAESPPNSVDLEDWKGRGITPIPYDSSLGHGTLTKTLVRWSELSAINGDPRRVTSLAKKIAKTPRKSAGEEDRDLFDHLYRRTSLADRVRLAESVSAAGADVDWLDAMLAIEVEIDRGYTK